MSWRTVEISPDVMLIQEGDTVAGSIGLIDGRWCVEVLWGGPGGDIKADFADYVSAVAFVRGVEKVFDRLKATTP